MFRIVYIDKDDNICHKGGFASDREAYTWLNTQNNITPLRLLVWSEQLQCFDLYKKL